MRILVPRQVTMSEETPVTETPFTDATRPLVMLLLPLSGRTVGAAEAVRDGFLSAYFAADVSVRPRLGVRDTARGGFAAAYLDAVAAGASAVVGPLTKDDVAAALPVADSRVVTLALNLVPDGAVVPSRFYQYALAPEDEARQLAHALAGAGKTVGVALVPAGDWGKRVLDSFQSAFTAAGGQLAASRSYPSGTSDYSGYIAELVGFEESRARHRALVAAVGVPLEFTPRRRDSVGFLFMAGQPVQGRLIRPQLKYNYAGELPIFSISDMYEPSPTANQDLDGLVFADMPWMLAPDAATLGARDDAQSLWSEGTRRRSRLYAFGADAFRLLDELRSPDTFRDTLAGFTGRLTLGPQGRVMRTLDWAQIQADGTIKPIDGP